MEIWSNKWLFQEDATTTGNGKIFYGNKNDTLTVFITGSSSSRIIYFEGMDDEGNWYSAPAFKMPDYTMASSTTGNNEAWEIDLSNWVAVRTRISTVSGGTVKITGRAVNKNG